MAQNDTHKKRNFFSEMASYHQYVTQRSILKVLRKDFSQF